MQDPIACAMVLDWLGFTNIVFRLYQTVRIIRLRKIIYLKEEKRQVSFLRFRLNYIASHLNSRITHTIDKTENKNGILKGAMSRFLQFEEFSLNFSPSIVVICVNLLHH